MRASERRVPFSRTIAADGQRSTSSPSCSVCGYILLSLCPTTPVSYVRAFRSPPCTPPHWSCIVTAKAAIRLAFTWTKRRAKFVNQNDMMYAQVTADLLQGLKNVAFRFLRKYWIQHLNNIWVRTRTNSTGLFSPPTIV